MEQKDIDILATDILKAIGESKASPIAKLEMLKNMRVFFENYNETLAFLQQNQNNIKTKGRYL